MNAVAQLDVCPEGDGTAGWPTRNPFRRRRLRRDADRLLRRGARPRPSSPLLAARAAELTSARERALLVRSLRGVLRELRGTTLPGASPLNRAGVRPHAAALEALARRLDDDSRPVGPRGVLLVHELLTSADSPLYAFGDADALPPLVDDALEALDER